MYLLERFLHEESESGIIILLYIFIRTSNMSTLYTKREKTYTNKQVKKERYKLVIEANNVNVQEVLVLIILLNQSVHKVEINISQSILDSVEQSSSPSLTWHSSLITDAVVLISGHNLAVL